jgi:UDP-N-acetylmuramoyl-L-alanyl-D-glutamate--2,6-diaminopimelate ligase
MGRVAGRYASFVVVTSDNPKGEDPRSIAEAVAEGVAETGAECAVVLDRRDAIVRAVERARRGTAVLLAGKGHETYQMVRGAFEPHSDGAALEALGFRRRETRPV